VHARGLGLQDAALDGARFDGAQLSYCDLTGATAARMSMRKVQASGGEWDRIDAPEADFTDATLEALILYHARLRGAIFRGAVLRRCAFDYADLTDADFSGSVIEDCDFHKAIGAPTNR
jgi:uncharacterized protein YjbI with pentapeptide repeats